MHKFMADKHPEIIEELDCELAISPDLDKALKAALNEFKSVYETIKG